jgi:hypothetical protein
MKKGLARCLLSVAATAIISGCVPVRHNLPPAQRLLEPGPGVGGPGPGILEPPAVGMGGGMMPGGMPGGAYPPAPQGDYATSQEGSAPGDMAGSGIMQTSASMPGGCPCGSCSGGSCSGGDYGSGYGAGYGGMMAMMPGNAATVQLAFTIPESMEVRYDATGSGRFDSEPLVVPAVQNFGQGGIYRLKLTNIVGREGVELYPTVEIACGTPRTGAYLAHNAIPIQFTPDDLDQVLTGNFVTKVIYLPDPEFQGPAIAGIDTLVSNRLDPGLDPIVEADRRGTILAIIRLGNKDIELGAEAGAPLAGYAAGGIPMAMGPCMTDGCATGYGPSGGATMPAALPGQIAGVTAPAYGMPMSGTPIGLPGPPHIPLGSPAGLQKHTIRNYTHSYIPKPVEDVKIGVRLQPGYSYPTPPSRINITEQNIRPGVPMGRPEYEMKSTPVGNGMMGGGLLNPGMPADGAYCPPQ